MRKEADVKTADVAVLYVDAGGPYPSLVENWYDESRDAETFSLDLPVVAHPPCGPWGRLKHLNRYQDPRHALHAIEVVRRNGGVLEHPHGSSLWRHAGLPASGEEDRFRGRTFEVDQCRFGHVARKRTWLYVVDRAGFTADGVLVRSAVNAHLIAQPADREPTHWCSGGRVPRSTGQTLVPAGIKVCSATQRRRTPVAFALWLIELARRCRSDVRS
jgi:hypothetical protein